MFFTHPHDALQEVAAQDVRAPFFPPHIHSLTSSLLSCCDRQNWDFNQELRLWFTREASTRPGLGGIRPRQRQRQRQHEHQTGKALRGGLGEQGAFNVLWCGRVGEGTWKCSRWCMRMWIIRKEVRVVPDGALLGLRATDVAGGAGGCGNWRCEGGISIFFLDNKHCCFRRTSS